MLPPPPFVHDFYVLEVAIGTLQQNMGTFHHAILLSCHFNENNRMTFHMITTTHVYSPIMHNACPITIVEHLATCDPKSITHNQWKQFNFKYDAIVTWLLNMQITLFIHYSSLIIPRNGLKVKIYNTLTP
jgi:hypothetical protein